MDFYYFFVEYITSCTFESSSVYFKYNLNSTSIFPKSPSYGIYPIKIIPFTILLLFSIVFGIKLYFSSNIPDDGYISEL